MKSKIHEFSSISKDAMSKTILRLTALSIILLPFGACGGKKSATAAAPAAPAPVAQTAPDDSYRLVVSFYSEGGGADMKTKDEFEKFLNGNAKKIAFEPTRWGREGETDYCLKLSELNAVEQADFVKKAKELLAKTKLVHVDENAKCVHKH